MTSLSRIPTAALAAALFAACSGTSQLPPVQSGVGIAVVSAIPADTIDARSRSDFEIVVYDSTGKGIANVDVDFRGQNMFVPGNPQYEGPWVGETGAATDGSGHAHIRYKRGDRAPAGQIVVSTHDPRTGVSYTDTIAFVITPGNPVGGHAIFPADTDVYTGTSFGIVAGGIDRGGDIVPMSATYAASSGVSVAATGTVTANAMGRSFVATTTAAGVDTAWISVVPHGEILAGRWGDSPDDSMVDIELAGPIRTLPIEQSVGGLTATWAPDGQHFVIATDGGLPMQSVDLQGNRVRLGPDSLGYLDRPRFSANGQFLFFGAVRDGVFSVFRSNADGSNPIALPFAARLDDAGSPSPDGQFVAGSLHDTIRVYSVPDGVARPWSVYGVAPLWSPDGRWIAVKLLDTDIGVIVDAITGAVVQDFGHRYPRDWSPDSQWLLVTEPSGGALLYRLSDGALVPLSSRMWQYTPLSWKASPPG
jgi:hypothetical protein